MARCGSEKIIRIFQSLNFLSPFPWQPENNFVEETQFISGCNIPFLPWCCVSFAPAGFQSPGVRQEYINLSHVPKASCDRANLIQSLEIPVYTKVNILNNKYSKKYQSKWWTFENHQEAQSYLPCLHFLASVAACRINY